MFFFLCSKANFFILEVIMVFIVPKRMLTLDEKKIHLGQLRVIDILCLAMYTFAVSFTCLHLMSVNN